MSLPRYPEYKDSGVEWLGEVPGHWYLSRHKYEATFSKGKNPVELDDEQTEGMLPYLSMEHLRGSQPATFAYPQSNSVIAADNQVLIIWDGSNAGEFVRGKSGIVSSTMAAARISGFLDAGYYWYYCQSIEPEMRNHARGMGIPHVNGDELSRIVVPVPSNEEQQTIAAFLDRETGKIDALIAEQQRLVELLAEKRQAVISHAITKGLNPNARMKDSGIEWLGEVPEHWEVMPLKRDLLFLTSGSRGWADHYADDGALFIRIGNLPREDIHLDLSDIQRVNVPDGTEGERTKVQAGDVLFSITAYLGSVAVVPKDLETAYVSQHVALARLSSQSLFPSWVAYLTLSSVGKTYLETQGYGGTKVQLSLDDVRNIPMLVPSLDEQQTIVSFLETETAKFDELTAEANRAIALLQERRSALISAAVTGKVDVRGLA